MKIRLLFLAFLLTAITSAQADDVDPLQLNFHREAVKRFIFGQEISLGGLVPAENVSPESMHPTLSTPGAAAPCDYRVVGSTLEMTGKGNGAGDSAIYVSGVFPFALYQVAVQSIAPGSELGIEFATVDRTTRVDVVAAPGAANFLVLRLFKAGALVRETPLYTGPALQEPYTLAVQLSGIGVGVYAIKDGQTTFLAQTTDKEDFRDVIDFRSRDTINSASFNLATNIPPGGKIVINSASAGLSSGIGQADLRMITHADGAPYIENNRLWFTFSSRGLGTDAACQGVMSLDPSVFDPRFEGVIVFDRGDGLLRNDYASDVFYDDSAKEWRAFTCCFSQSAKGRGDSGLAVAHSIHDPRRGFSVMSSTQLTHDKFPGRHEDPCIVYDSGARKWRVLTSSFDGGIRASLFESDNWDGPYTKIAGPVPYDSTGTLIQKIGSKRYVFSGTQKGPSGKGAILIYSYPDLAYLGEMKVDLPATLVGGRIWPGVYPLPPGFPARYIALTMDRKNFPGVKGPNWSYGSLYFYWANTPTIDGAYEYDSVP